MEQLSFPVGYASWFQSPALEAGRAPLPFPQCGIDIHLRVGAPSCIGSIGVPCPYGNI
jgi:hypothetical protein